ncbi:MAG: M16 family metallopeptidase [Kofleriaceae bacterium]
MRAALVATVLVSLATAHAQPADPFAASPVKDWTKPPPPTKEPAFKPPVAKRLKLKNGMALLVVENHKLPILSMVLVVPGAGSAEDPKGKYGLASFTADLLDEGAGGLSPIAIAEESDRLGASIGIGVDSDAAYVSVSTLSKTLDDTLGLFSKVLTQPAFDDKEVERVKGDRLTSLELRRDRPREVAINILNAALFGAESAYGHPTSGARETFKDVTGADAKTFYSEHWNPAAMTLVVAGDVDAAALKTKLDAGIGAWTVKGAKKPAKVSSPAQKITRRLLVVDRKDAAQSDVRIGLVGLDRKDKRYAQFEVFRTAFGDGFTSRLTQTLREKMGIVYNAGAVADWRVAKGPFFVSTAIQTPSTGQGIGTVLAILDDLAKNNLPKDELEKAKQNIIRALPATFGTNAAVAGAFADLALHGLPDNWYARYAASVRTVTATQVKAIAKAAMPSDKVVISIVGDYTRIKPEIDKLSLGEPAMHDPYGLPVK